MTRTTRAQRVALLKIYDRAPLRLQDGKPVTAGDHVDAMILAIPYRRFRSLVQPTSTDDAIVVPWCGMWLCIETDGYTHS